MKGFYIGVRNDLLEPKHVEKIAESIWLFLWLIDKQTGVDINGKGSVLYGSPIKFEQVKEELGISQKTYKRWIAKLRKEGYIETIRTMHGLIFFIDKPKDKTIKRGVTEDPSSNSEGSQKAPRGVTEDPSIILASTSQKEIVSRQAANTLFKELVPVNMKKEQGRHNLPNLSQRLTKSIPNKITGESSEKSAKYVKTLAFIEKNREKWLGNSYDIEPSMYNWKYVLNHGKLINPTKLLVVFFWRYRKKEFSDKFKADLALKRDLRDAKSLVNIIYAEDLEEVLDAIKDKYKKSNLDVNEWPLSSIEKQVELIK